MSEFWAITYPRKRTVRSHDFSTIWASSVCRKDGMGQFGMRLRFPSPSSLNLSSRSMVS